MAESGIITKARRVSLCKITSGEISALPPITQIALGSGGVDENGEPLIPLEDQTALHAEEGIFPIDGVEYPVDTTARYTVTIPRNELVGVKISEAALVDSEGTLCAIKNMYVKQKDGDVTFTFTFDDEF